MKALGPTVYADNAYCMALAKDFKGKKSPPTNMARVSPSEIVDAKCPKWLPPMFHDGGEFAAHAVATAGLPWALGTQQYGMRSLIDLFPFNTLGGLLFCHTGQHALALVPVQAIIDRGSGPAGLHSMLSGLTAAVAKSCLGKHAIMVKIDAGETVWIPYGMQSWLFGTSTGVPIAALTPVLSPKFFEYVSDEVNTNISKYVLEFLEKSPANPWKSYYEPVKKFTEIKVTR